MDAAAIVSKVLEDLTSITAREIEQEVRLVEFREVAALISKLRGVKAVLADAEIRQLKEDGVRRWMDNLIDIAYDMDDLLDEWSTAIGKLLIKGDDEKASRQYNNKKKVRFLTCFSCLQSPREVGLRHDIAVKIRDLKERFDAILNEQRLFKFKLHQMETTTLFERSITSSVSNVEEVKGREEEKDVIINKLLNESSQTPKLHIVSIVGMGGIGKTTLASLAYNDSAVKAHFEKSMWICVSDPFDELRVAKKILESLILFTPNLVELQSVLQKIQQSLEGKKFLLVLDDVWEENSAKWDNLKLCLKCGSAGSRILVTTRKENAARAIGCNDVYKIGVLSEDNCWLLFSQSAFYERHGGERQQLEDIGRKIVRKCNGLPLAAKSLGGLLRSKWSRIEWQSILESEIWELEIAEVGIFPHLWFSYHDLSPALRLCFLYCAVFPKGYTMEKCKLVGSWMAHGYLRETGRQNMETLGEEYFETLASCSLFQEFKKDKRSGRIEKCKMHDIMHDFALYMTRTKCFRMEDTSGSMASASTVCSKIRHAWIKLSSTGNTFPISFPSSVYDMKKLHGLRIEFDGYSSNSISEVLRNLFNELIYLRSLDISHCEMKLIPSTISQLIHLRQIDLSGNDKLEHLPETVGELYNLQILHLRACRNLQWLPETLGELYNLQTLDLRACQNLKKLPHGIGKLDNLRDLHNRNRNIIGKSSILPKRIGRLSSLRALDEVDVGHEEDKDAFCLADFEKLNGLRGHLMIQGLGNVTNVSGAKRASLKNKSQITSLFLWFDGEEGERRAVNDKELLQVLEPTPNLKGLTVFLYRGTSFSPTWMLSLTQLKDLKLSSFENCEHLPPNLGKLPCLESVELTSFTKLKSVGVGFWGIEEEDSLQISSAIVLFPKLRTLKFFYFVNWEEWDDQVSNFPASIIIMPCLGSLIFEYCPKLKTLPHLLLQNKITPKEKLKMVRCPILAERYNKRMEPDSDWSKISHVSRIQIDGKTIKH